MTLTAPVDSLDHVDGPDDAPVTLVVYGDYECPYTRATHEAIRKVQERREIAFRYVFRQFPLVQIHPHAMNAARTAEAAAAAGAFWPVHDALFANQHALDDAALTAYAATSGVSAAAVRAALEQGIHDRRIARDVDSGVASGVEGTPTLFLNGRRYTGPRDTKSLGEAIRGAGPAS